MMASEQKKAIRRAEDMAAKVRFEAHAAYVRKVKLRWV
jgi:hypothetical protein